MGVCGSDAHRGVDVHDHLPPGLVAFAVVGPFLFQLKHAVAGGAVLQRKLTEDFTEPVDADVSHAVGRVTEEQQERMEPARGGKIRKTHLPVNFLKSFWEIFCVVK